MARTFANPDRPFQVTDQAGLAQLGTDVLTGELGIAPVGMIAYHGTPHLIKDKFDVSKIGTGEGAQAYGHGMYFAEAPAVAQSYKQDFIQSDKTIQALQKFRDDYPVNSPNWNHYDNLMNRNKEGNLYKVDIPDEYVPKMLDWDKPLSQQPKSVQDALAKIDSDSYSPKGMDYDPNELGQAIYHRLAQKSDEPLRQEWVKKRDMLLEKGLTNNPELEAHLMTNPNPYQVGSQVLNEYGIKGIRYLDAGSREAGGTSNFVVFDPTDVKILERNNQPVEGLLGN
jgi:Fe-S cluster biosynthesis and repair protein YggX